MRHYYTFNQNGNFTNGVFGVGPVMEDGRVTKIMAGALTAGTGDAVANVTCTNGNGATALTTVDIALGGAAALSNGIGVKGTLHGTPANLAVAEGDVLSIEFADANAGTGALPIDTTVCIEVTSEN